MLSKRIYKVLTFLEHKTDWVDRLDTPFSEDDFYGLTNDGYVIKTDLSIFDEDGEYTNKIHPGYKITVKGKDALELHRDECERSFKASQEQLKFNKSTLRWSRIAGITAIVTGVLGLLSLLIAVL